MDESILLFSLTALFHTLGTGLLSEEKTNYLLYILLNTKHNNAFIPHLRQDPTVKETLFYKQRINY